MAALLSRASVFIKNIPKTQDDWLEKRRRHALDSRKGVLEVFDCLLLRNIKEHPIHHLPDNIKKPGFPEFLICFGKAAAQAPLGSGENQPVSYYRWLVFLTLYEIALAAQYSLNTVNNAQRIFYAILTRNNEYTEPILRKYRGAVK